MKRQEDGNYENLNLNEGNQYQNPLSNNNMKTFAIGKNYD